MTGSTPLEDTTQKRANQLSNQYYLTADTPTPPPASFAPYTATKPVTKQTPRTEQPPITTTTTITRERAEFYEMTPRQTTRPPVNPSRTHPSTTDQTTVNQVNRNGKSRNDYASYDDNKVSSQF